MTPPQTAATTVPPGQPLQVLINAASLTLAGWLAKKGFDESSAYVVAAAVVALVVPVLIALAQRTKLFLTPSPTQVTTINTPADAASRTSGGTGPHSAGRADTRAVIAASMLLGLLLLVMFAGLGCSADPAVRLADTTRAVTLAATSIQAADQAGYLQSPDTRRRLDVLLLAITDSVNRANALQATAATQPAMASPDAIRGFVDAANAQLPRLLQLLADETKSPNRAGR